jgi:hypothetical protein
MSERDGETAGRRERGTPGTDTARREYARTRGKERKGTFQATNCGAKVYGTLGDQERARCRDALMSGVDEKVVRQMEGERALGLKEFAATLKMERGRHRVKRGRSWKTAATTA